MTLSRLRSGVRIPPGSPSFRWAVTPCAGSATVSSSVYSYDRLHPVFVDAAWRRDPGESGFAVIVIIPEEAVAIDPEALRLLIRQKLADGRLSRRRLLKVTGGPSPRVASCHICEEPFQKDEMAMEPLLLEGSGETQRMHVQCFWAWESELRSQSSD